MAAAATGNGVGIAGAGRDTSILAVKVADVTGRIFTDDLAAGIVWATDHGANVVNLSLGGPTSDPLERAAVAYAEAHDVLVVAAAGNEGSRPSSTPAALPGVLAVGATTATARRGPRSPATAPGSTSPHPAARSWSPRRAVATSRRRHVVLRAARVRLPLRCWRPTAPAAPPRSWPQALVAGADTARLGFAHGLLHVDRVARPAAAGRHRPISAPAARRGRQRRR